MVKLFTREQERFLRSNVAGRGNKELTDLMNEKFNLNLNVDQVRSWKKNHRVSSGLSGRFKKGHIPANKGTKGMFNVGGNKTSFKKGNVPSNHKLVGSERIDRDGYIVVKIQEGNWRYKHHVVWESAHVRIPNEHCLIFVDGNKLNTNLSNLKLIEKSQNLQLNKNGLRTNNPEFLETALLLTDVIMASSKLKRKISENRKERKNEFLPNEDDSFNARN